MQLISDSTLLEMYQTLGDDSALLNGSLTVTGIFTNKFLMVNALGELVESNTPTFTCRTSDVTTIANGMTCVIDTQNYIIETLEPDSQGQTVIMLHV